MLADATKYHEMKKKTLYSNDSLSIYRGKYFFKQLQANFSSQFSYYELLTILYYLLIKSFWLSNKTQSDNIHRLINQ